MQETQEQVLRAVTSAYGQARQQLLMDNRLMEQRMAAGEQIRQTAELLKRAAKGLTGIRYLSSVSGAGCRLN